MAQYNAGRTCLVTLQAEPRGWQSMKTDQRLEQQQVLIRHWAQLGFTGSPGIAHCATLVTQVVRGYRVPGDLATWDPLTDQDSHLTTVLSATGSHTPRPVIGLRIR